jgi:hypothetical protein
MGNRAVITTRCNNAEESNNIGIYLHWNGGRDSIEAFLKYCKIKKFRCPEDDNYGWARLCQVIANYFGSDNGGLSVGIGKCCNLDCNNYDNGVYIVEDWEIIDRQYYDYGEEQSNYELREMLVEIDKAQPREMQIGKEKIKEYLNNIE